MERWPNFFIVGAAKAGTTSLYEYLKIVPGIYMSPVKEPGFFSTQKKFWHPDRVKNKKEYLNLFKKVKNEKIIGEASIAYLADRKTPKLIHEVSPNAKILISLRDAVERAFSGYLMYIRDGLTTMTFNESIQKFQSENSNKEIFVRLDNGFYTDNVKRYQSVFGEKNVKIIIFEEFVSNPIQTIQNILKFLGLNYENLNFEPEQHNPYFVVRGKFAQKIRMSKTLRPIVKNLLPLSLRKSLRTKFIIKKMPKPKMNQDDKDFLVKLYREDVQKLETLLGRKLPWPNFQN